jgi:tetratricopeptide (TPR) repeat protein
MSRRCLFLSLLLLASCAAKQRPAAVPPSPELLQQAAYADGLSRKGSYVALKQAVLSYTALYALPGFRVAIAPKLATASLLLAVREKELGISNKSYMDMALRVIQDNRSLSGLTPYAEIAGLYWVQGKGVMTDADDRFPPQETEEKLKAMDTEFSERAKVDEFSAYMYATLKCLQAQPLEKIAEPERLSALFPDSLMLKFKSATCPQENEELLISILAQDPEFYEAAYYLGMLSLSRGNLLQAESHFLKMREGIPESAQATILLASIAFALEEVERALEFYEATLEILPNYRDALLGKAICLSTLGRPQEAIAVCEQIIALGYWLLGESYYWIAWNQHELKDYAAAETSIEQSKGRLPTSAEVFTLSGLIAVERGDLLKAEKEFQEALRYDPSRSDVLYNLGDLYVRKEDWAGSGLYFEKAGFAFENEAEGLREKIVEVEKSTLAPLRKEALVKKRKARMERALLSRATSFYNAAAGYFNAGQKYKALEMATRSAEHPAFKQKAEELASGIK